jgi:hypothetical protein
MYPAQRGQGERGELSALFLVVRIRRLPPVDFLSGDQVGHMVGEAHQAWLRHALVDGVCPGGGSEGYAEGYAERYRFVGLSACQFVVLSR